MSPASEAPAPWWSLDVAGATDRRLVGGKAAGLARLAGAGVRVPEAVVVPADRLAVAARAAGLDRLLDRVTRAGAAEVRDRIRSLPLPPGWAEAWVTAARRLGPRVAVRSSAVAEDGRVHSYAGLFATRVDVTPEDVPHAIREVWASAFGDEVFVYRGGTARPDEVGVVLQRMVRPAVSGVVFTVNPATGSWRELVVEAVWGQGGPLVAGRVAPQAFLVRRPAVLPGVLGRLRGRLALALVDADLAAPSHWVPPDGGPLAPLPERLAGQRTLTEDALFAVCRAALAVERHLGVPVDVEWVLDELGTLWIVQARPITAGVRPTPRRKVLWTRRFLGERWSQPPTPLGWSLVAPVLEHFVAYPQTQRHWLGGGPALRLVDGWPYVNATVFRSLLFKLPGLPPPAFLLELLPPGEALAWRRRRAGLPDLPVYAALLRETVAERRWERFAWNPTTNHLAWRRIRRRIHAALPSLAGPLVSSRDGVRRVEAHLALLRAYVGVHVTSLLFAHLAHQLLDGALHAACPTRARAWGHALTTTPPGNPTVRGNRALWVLAHAAGPGDLDALAEGSTGSPGFARALEAFLARWGDRASSSWEILAPRWADDPSQLAPLLRLRADDPDDPAAHARRRADAAEEALDALRSEAPVAWRPVLLGLVWYVRRYVALREQQRRTFDAVAASLRRTLLGLGDRLAGDGHLDEADEVAFLTWEELRGLALDADHVPDARDRVARRRAARTRDARRRPPVTLTADGDPSPDDADRLDGRPVVAGRARGRVRVVRTPADAATLDDGDVLVAPALDPSWTAMLPTVAAAVVELGGVLSHGAVLAREYGVPMVGDVEGATRLLQDGEDVTVDGHRGVVWRHRDAPTSNHVERSSRGETADR